MTPDPTDETPQPTFGYVEPHQRTASSLPLPDPTPSPTPEGLFDWAEDFPREGLSVDQRRTQRNKWLLKQGVHPLTKRAILGHGTCGECAHHRQHGTYHKCDLNYTNGAATDIRVSWPACELFRTETP